MGPSGDGRLELKVYLFANLKDVNYAKYSSPFHFQIVITICKNLHHDLNS